MIAYKDSHLQEQLRIFNTLWKAQDDIWQEAARNSGLPETAFWIIYILNLLRQSYATHGSYPDRHATLLSKNWKARDSFL